MKISMKFLGVDIKGEIASYWFGTFPMQQYSLFVQFNLKFFRHPSLRQEFLYKI